MSGVRVATICLASKGYPTVEENRRYALKLVDRALKVKPDLVCLPEAFTTFTIKRYRSLEELAEELDGPTVKAFSNKAIEGGCYIICPIITMHDGALWNSAVVIDRSGGIVGVYDKVHPVTSTYDYTIFEDGVTPGRDYPVFNLDFGCIGIQICFDICFPEGWIELARKGAKMVFWVSAYNGGFPLQAYACLNRYYVVSSVRTDRSMIIDPCGRILAETDSMVNIAYYDVSLDYVVCHYDFNYSIPDLILERYSGRIRVRSYKDDALFIVECMDRGLRIEDIQKEFSFESFQQYIDRHRYAYKCIHEGASPQPQKAAHGSRPQYQKWL